jgi:hypothetical protein
MIDCKQIESRELNDVKKAFQYVSTAGCLLIVSRHFGVSFLNTYYWRLASIFLGALFGQAVFMVSEKRKTVQE